MVGVRSAPASTRDSPTHTNENPRVKRGRCWCTRSGGSISRSRRRLGGQRGALSDRWRERPQGVRIARLILRDSPVHFAEPVHFAGTGTLTASVAAVRESDTRMCKSIGVDVATGVAAMVKLWGRPFSAERDSRAEPGANAQRTGQISRQLKAELQKVVTDGDD